MIKILDAENALKSIYLSAVTERLNTQTNPLLTKIEQTTSDVWGKEIRVLIEDGDGFTQFISPLKNLYAQFKMSSKLIVKAGQYLSRFVDLFDEEISSVLKDVKVDLSRMLYGNAQDSKELTGIGAIFDMDKPLYGVERGASAMMRPLIKEVDGITDSVMDDMINELTERGANIDYIVMPRDIREAYLAQHKNVDVIQLDHGYKALSHNGIPLVYDSFVPQGTAYFLDTGMFKLHQLFDWQWLERIDGSLLRKVSGEDAYTAILVKYGDLLCHRPDRQGMIRVKNN